MYTFNADWLFAIIKVSVRGIKNQEIEFLHENLYILSLNICRQGLWYSNGKFNRS